jgi:hypothetical protein
MNWTRTLTKICISFGGLYFTDSDVRIVEIASNCTQLEILQLHEASFKDSDPETNAKGTEEPGDCIGDSRRLQCCDGISNTIPCDLTFFSIDLMQLPEQCATLKIVQLSAPIGFNVPPSLLDHPTTKFILQLLTIDELAKIHQDTTTAEYDYMQFLQQLN